MAFEEKTGPKIIEMSKGFRPLHNLYTVPIGQAVALHLLFALALAIQRLPPHGIPKADGRYLDVLGWYTSRIVAL